MATRISDLHHYAYEILSHLCVKINQPSLIEDSWLEMKHPEEVATEVLKESEGTSAQCPFIGVSEDYVLLPCGNAVAMRHDPTVMKQVYMVHHRNTLEPVITFRVGYDNYQHLCTLLKDSGFTLENSTTVIIVSKTVR